MNLDRAAPQRICWGRGFPSFYASCWLSPSGRDRRLNRDILPHQFLHMPRQLQTCREYSECPLQTLADSDITLMPIISSGFTAFLSFPWPTRFLRERLRLHDVPRPRARDIQFVGDRWGGQVAKFLQRLSRPSMENSSIIFPTHNIILSPAPQRGGTASATFRSRTPLLAQ